MDCSHGRWTVEKAVVIVEVWLVWNWKPSEVCVVKKLERLLAQVAGGISILSGIIQVGVLRLRCRDLTALSFAPNYRAGS